jgi:protocatechuate 3,4-dioxygenase beta subunit
MRPPRRRDFLHRLGYGLAAVPILGCGGGGGDQPLVDGPDEPPIDMPPGADEWASGGTKSMTDKATYPDPFTSAPASCILVATTTIGPCTTVNPPVREDISEAWTGIPVRLALKVVDAACAPLVGATVRIWHTNIEGSYSGQTPSPQQCILMPQHASVDFFRGVQSTAADGTAFFDTCFPGWYPGRAIHIHFQVLVGNVSTRVSQLFFPEDLTRDIFMKHSEYRGFGQPNTTNSTDGVLQPLAAADVDRLTFDIAKMTDRAMLASKVITVRS